MWKLMRDKWFFVGMVSGVLGGLLMVWAWQAKADHQTPRLAGHTYNEIVGMHTPNQIPRTVWWWVFDGKRYNQFTSIADCEAWRTKFYQKGKCVGEIKR